MRRSPLLNRPTRREDLADYYAALLARQAESGLSVSDFAVSIGVSTWTLYEWRRRLAGSADCDDVRVNQQRVVEVSVLPSSASQSSGIRVELRSGHRLDVRPGFEDHDLRRLIGVLESC